MLLDLDGSGDDAATHALECLCKAAGEGSASIWTVHQSPFLKTLVESFTDNGLQVSAAMATEVMDWLTGKMYSAKFVHSPRPPRYPWSDSDLPAVAAYLRGMTPAQMSFDDWTMLGDYIVSVHAPANGFIDAHAQWMAARASTLGRLQAEHPNLPQAKIDNALASLPSTVKMALASFNFTPAQTTAMQYAAAHCAENIVSATNTLRSSIKNIVLEEMANPHLPGAPSESLQSKLLDAFGTFNRDWRRIAVTEAGEAANQGQIASLPTGVLVRRLEQYVGACGFCRKIDGKLFTVVSPQAENKDGKTQIWPGKTNVGRSASPNKIVDGVLVPRTPDELWWPAAGLQHPHCRGLWSVQTAQTGNLQQDAKWAAWLSAIGVV